MSLKKPNPCYFIWFLCWAVYTSAYFCRVNLSIALPFLSATGEGSEGSGYSRTVLGLMASGFFGAYAAGQLVNGALGDRFNPRWFVAAGLAAAGLSNIFFGMSHNLAAMILLWAVNGYFQSMLWGPLVRIVAERTPQEYLDRGIVLLSTSPIIGYFLSYAVVGRISLYAGWKAAFFIPGVLLIFIAGFWFLAFRTRTQEHHSLRESTPDCKERLLPFIFRTRLWAVALICIMGGIVKEGLVLWGPDFLSKSQALSMDMTLFIMSLIPLINLPILILSGYVYRSFRHREKYTLLIFSAASLLCTVFLRTVLERGFILVGIAFAGIFASLYALNNILTSFLPLNFHQEQRVSTAAGFLDCAVYIGAAISGPLTGLMADSGGWQGVTLCWITAVAAVIPLCFIPLRRRS